MSKRRISLLVKISVTLAFFAVLFTNKNITFENLAKIWDGVNTGFLATAFVLSLTCLGLHMVRWHYFTKSIGYEEKPLTSALAYMAGTVVGFITPGRAGEFARGIFYDKYTVKDIAWVTFAEKLYYILFILAFGILALVFRGAELHGLIRIPLTVALPLLLLLAVGIAALILNNTRVPIQGIARFFPAKANDRLFLLTLSNLIYILLVFQLYFILLSFGPVRLTHAFVTYAVTLLALTFLPIAVGNLGIRETCFIVILKTLGGVDESISFTAGLIVFIQNVLFPSGLGILSFFLIRSRQR